MDPDQGGPRVELVAAEAFAPALCITRLPPAAQPEFCREKWKHQPEKKRVCSSQHQNIAPAAATASSTDGDSPAPPRFASLPVPCSPVSRGSERIYRPMVGTPSAAARCASPV